MMSAKTISAEDFVQQNAYYVVYHEVCADNRYRGPSFLQRISYSRMHTTRVTLRRAMTIAIRTISAEDFVHQNAEGVDISLLRPFRSLNVPLQELRGCPQQPCKTHTAHVCTNKPTHARVHAHTRRQSRTYAHHHARPRARTHTHAHTHAHTRTHSREHARTHAHIRTHSGTHASTHAHTHAYYTHIQTCMLVYVYSVGGFLVVACISFGSLVSCVYVYSRLLCLLSPTYEKYVLSRTMSVYLPSFLNE